MPWRPFWHLLTTQENLYVGNVPYFLSSLSPTLSYLANLSHSVSSGGIGVVALNSALDMLSKLLFWLVYPGWEPESLADIARFEDLL